ncbi:NUDIX domain-containing protein [Candidatus Pelagibacter sp.]|uniref:NUDIX domain-containing protein n=1 Tax=Candidatus Pelagibacter sp. TaxID=2024849 RepID=UPI003D101B4A
MDIICSVFLIDGKKILLQHRDNFKFLRRPNYWVPPGGKKKNYENNVSCAKREFFEETGYKIKNLYFFYEGIERSLGWPINKIIVYKSIYDRKQKISCYEGQNMKFVNFKEHKKLLIPKNILKILKKAF